MTWHMIRSFRSADYRAVMRCREPHSESFRFEWTTSRDLTSEMRRKHRWYVAGWKIHLSIYPADYARALRALRKFEERVASTGLVFKYASSRRLYENFTGEVKGKFVTIYCKVPTDIQPMAYLVNRLFDQQGITPVSRIAINQMEGLRNELPLIGGYGFVRYGAFCYTKGILDLTDPGREPLQDSRLRPFPLFSDPRRLAAEMAIFRDLIEPTCRPAIDV